MRGDERRGEEEEAEEGEAVMPSVCYRGRFYVTFCVLRPTARKEQEKEGRKGDDASERKRSSERVLI